MNDDVTYGNTADEPMNALQYGHKLQGWHYFIDSTKISLKDAILHLRVSRVGHAVRMGDSYEHSKFLLSCIQNNKCCWNICGNLVVSYSASSSF